MPDTTKNPRFDQLYLWFMGAPGTPRLIGTLNLVTTGKGMVPHDLVYEDFARDGV